MEKNLSLFQIQDDDRPMWVVAENWNDALAKWKAQIALENQLALSEVTEPKGILLVCEHNDLLS